MCIHLYLFFHHSVMFNFMDEKMEDMFLIEANIKEIIEEYFFFPR